MNLFLIQANYCLPVNYWSEKSCSEVKSSGIRMSHLDFKLKKKKGKKVTWLFYEILSFHFRHQTIMSTTQQANGYLQLNQPFQWTNCSQGAAVKQELLKSGKHRALHQDNLQPISSCPSDVPDVASLLLSQMCNTEDNCSHHHSLTDFLKQKSQAPCWLANCLRAKASVLHKWQRISEHIQQQRVSQVLSHTRKQFSGSEL